MASTVLPPHKKRRRRRLAKHNTNAWFLPGPGRHACFDHNMNAGMDTKIDPAEDITEGEEYKKACRQAVEDYLLVVAHEKLAKDYQVLSQRAARLLARKSGLGMLRTVVLIWRVQVQNSIERALYWSRQEVLGAVHGDVNSVKVCPESTHIKRKSRRRWQ